MEQMLSCLQEFEESFNSFFLSLLCRHLTLSQSDMAALTGGKGFPFLFQHIRDGINIRQTCNLIFSLCRYNNRLAEHVGLSQTLISNDNNLNVFIRIHF